MAPAGKNKGANSHHATAKLSQIGLTFPGGKGNYKVGRCLGQGAQGSVHAIIDARDGCEIPYVSKLARHPLVKAPPKSRKKRTTEEINIGMIYTEYQMYLSHFKPFRGDIIPDFPGQKKEDVPTYGDIECGDDGGPGFRFLTVERMESPFFDLVDSLVENACSGNADAVSLGPICTRMMEILKAFHDKGYVFVDIKPDNFMLASSLNTKKKSAAGSGTSNATKKRKNQQVQHDVFARDLASRIRWLDLALVQRLTDLHGKSVVNEGTNQIHGTPLYASLHVHHLNTPTRRDDLFALGVVLSELIIRTATCMQLTHDEDEDVAYLPWSSEQSDEAVGKVKEAQILDRNSLFYHSMPTSDIADNMHHFLNDAHSLAFKATPDYDKFLGFVSSIKIPAMTTTKKAQTAGRRGTGKVSSSSATGNKRSGNAASKKQQGSAVAATAPQTSKEVKEGTPVLFTTKLAAATSKKQNSAKVARAATSNADDSEEEVEEVRPAATHARAHLKRGVRSDGDTAPLHKARKSVHVDLDDAIMEDVGEDEGDENDNYNSCNEAEPMDVDDMDEEENRKPAAVAKSKVGIQLLVIKGPDQGKSFIIEKGNNKPKEAVIGANPNVRKSEMSFRIVGDKSIGQSHVKVKGIFGVKAPSCSVEVTDLSGTKAGVGVGNTCKTSLDEKPLAPGSRKTVHRHGLIGLGTSTVIQVKWWEGNSATGKENFAS